MQVLEEYIRNILLFYRRFNKKATETAILIQNVYEKHIVSEIKFQFWFSRFGR